MPLFIINSLSISPNPHLEYCRGLPLYQTVSEECSFGHGSDMVVTISAGNSRFIKGKLEIYHILQYVNICTATGYYIELGHKSW